MLYRESSVSLLTEDRNTVSQENDTFGCQLVIQSFELRDQLRYGNRHLISHCDQAVALKAINAAVYLLSPCIHDRTDKPPYKSQIVCNPRKGRYLYDRFSESKPEPLRGS